jgi:hypothetical protein
MADTTRTIAEEMKELLPNPVNRIKLDDFVSMHLKKFLEATSPEHFPTRGATFQQADFLKRLERYEELTGDLRQIVILLAKWGDREHLLLLEKIFTRLAEGVQRESDGLNVWLRLNWYPLQVLMYAAGIAALAAHKYDALKIVLGTEILHALEDKHVALVVMVTANVSDTAEFFKHIPGQEQKYTPRSDRLFELLEPILNELLFLDKSYEEVFDEFEVYLALTFADMTTREWAPVGRFGWKYRNHSDNPLDHLVSEATKKGEEWGPCQAGLFEGSSKRFIETAEKVKERNSKLNWW